jgi:hypothetical protein
VALGVVSFLALIVVTGLVDVEVNSAAIGQVGIGVLFVALQQVVTVASPTGFARRWKPHFQGLPPEITRDGAPPNLHHGARQSPLVAPSRPRTRSKI